MTRKEIIHLSILKTLRLGGEYMTPEDILSRAVQLELTHMQVRATEVAQAATDLETGGKIASETDDYGNCRFLLKEPGRAMLITRGI